MFRFSMQDAFGKGNEAIAAASALQRNLQPEQSGSGFAKIGRAGDDAQSSEEIGEQEEEVVSNNVAGIRMNKFRLT